MGRARGGFLAAATVMVGRSKRRVLALVSGLMFFVARLRRHFELHPEYARKIVHVGSGLMAMALPCPCCWAKVALAMR